MPFREVWSETVNEAIRRVCVQIARTFPGFTAEKADEITEPGRITDQIVSAIERADVLVADITGSNANVMFELGYADALSKPIIVLNQSVDATPFDIRDWRQIGYTTDDLRKLSRTLTDFMAGTLLRLGFSRAAATGPEMLSGDDLPDEELDDPLSLA
jgi:nucleoside 2-deoxyribosyltransferase